MKNIIKKLFNLYDDYDLINFHVNTEQKPGGYDIGNGWLMWEPHIKKWKNEHREWFGWFKNIG